MRQFVAVLAIVAVSVAVSHCGQSSADVSEVQDSFSSQPPTFLKVNDKLFRSGDLDRGDFPFLKAQGIKTIVSLEHLSGEVAQGDREDEWASSNNIPLFRVPMEPSNKPTVAQIRQALEYINDPQNQPVLVHCFHGKDRTGIVIAAYRMTADHWTMDHAIVEMRRLGHLRSLYWWDDVLENFQ